MTQTSGVLWITEQVKTKLAAATWSIFLFFGGLIFILYFAHIRFMPELEIGSSIALLAAAAITGAVYLLALSITLVVPSIFWSAVILNLSFFKPIFYEHQKVLKVRVLLWLLLPLLLVLLVSVTAMILVSDRFDTIVTLTVPSVALMAWIVLTLVLFADKRRALRRLETSTATNVGRKRLRGLKIKLILQASAKSTIYWLIYAGSCFCFVLPMVLVDFVVQIPGEGREIPYLIGLVTLTLGVNVLVTIASNWANTFRWQALIGISASFLLLLFFEATTNISSSVMNIYGLGNIPNSFVVLKPEGCALLAQAGVNKCPKTGEMCILNNAHILSRIGPTYYLHTTNAEGKAVKLTIPRDVVLSWGRRPDEVHTFASLWVNSRNQVLYSILIDSLHRCNEGDIVVVSDQTLVPVHEALVSIEGLQQIIEAHRFSFEDLSLPERWDIQREAEDFLKSAAKSLSGLSRSKDEDNERQLLGAEFRYPLINKANLDAMTTDNLRWAEFQKAHPNGSVVFLSRVAEGRDFAAVMYRLVSPNGEQKFFVALFHKTDQLWTLRDKLEIRPLY
jgi:hypothetical protein